MSRYLEIISLTFFATILSACGSSVDSRQSATPSNNASISEQEQLPQTPNIVLIMADDLGWEDVGFNGSDIAVTPNLDAMASNGLVFDRFYSASPVCSPTRASVMTGRHPHRFGVTNANVGKLKNAELSLAELLKQKGYATGFFGKWHLGTLTTTTIDANRGGRSEHSDAYSPPTEHGFDVTFATESKTPTFDPMIKPRDQAKFTWWDPVTDPDNAVEYGTFYWDTNGDKVDENLTGDDSRIIVDRAIEFIETAATREEPFVAVIWLHTPHLPVVAGASDRRPFSELPSYDQHFFGSVLAMDREIGRVRDTLSGLGISNNTIVAFTSDNGPEHLYADQNPPGRAGQFRGTKRSLYEGGVRVPSIIEWPAVITEPRRSNTIGVTTDYLPTVADIVGAELPNRNYDGKSLKPILEGGDEERNAPVGFIYLEQESLVGDRYKLLRNSALKRPPHDNGTIPNALTELYDLIDDPSETKNIAEEHPLIVEEMSNSLNEWKASLDESASGADYE